MKIALLIWSPTNRFWNRSGIEIDASLSGVSVKAHPLKSLIEKGGIALIPCLAWKTKLENVGNFTLISKSAQIWSSHLLETDGTQEVLKGMPIEYQGVKVGEVTLVVPNFRRNLVEVTARILPEYVANIAVEGTHFG